MESMRRLLAALTVYENNFRILHWKRAGEMFHTDHERIGTYYDKLGEFMDQIAEYGIVAGVSPVTAAEAMEIIKNDPITFIELDPSKEYDGHLADEISVTMFEQLYAVTVAAIQEARKTDNFVVEDLLIQQSHFYYIDGKYKLGQRFKSTTVQPATPKEPIIISERPEYEPEYDD